MITHARVSKFSGTGTQTARTSLAHSWAWYIQKGVMDRVKVMPFFSSFVKFGLTHALQVQPDHLPYCGVYILTETLGPDGDANHGEPRFIHVVKLGFSVMIQNNDPEKADDKLDMAFQALMDGLLTDPTLYHNDGWKIESYINGSRSHHFGLIGANEVPMAELRFELSLNFRTYWPPRVVDDLEVIHVEVVQEGDVDDQGVQRILAEYDLQQEE